MIHTLLIPYESNGSTGGVVVSGAQRPDGPDRVPGFICSFLLVQNERGDVSDSWERLSLHPS